MNHNQIRTPALITKAKRLRARGMSFCAIAKALGVKQGLSIRTWIDPEYQEHRRRFARDAKKTRSVGFAISKRPQHAETVERDAALLALAIPPDTRDLSARLCGDPLPGRRAIDFKREMNGEHNHPR